MLRKAKWLFGNIGVLICVAMLLVACGGSASTSGTSMRPPDSANDHASTKKPANIPPAPVSVGLQRCSADALSVSMRSAPQIATQTSLYFASSSQQGSMIYAVNAHDGTARWCELPMLSQASSCSGNGSADPGCPPSVKTTIGAATIANDMMYICIAGPSGGYIFAFTAHEGSPHWYTRTDCHPSDTPFTDPEQPIVDHDIVYVGSSSGAYALAANTGAVIWHTISPVSLASLKNGVLYGYSYGPNESAVYALNARDGSLLWKYNLFPRAIVSNVPIVADGSVYFATLDLDNTFYALNAANGTLRWSYHIGAVASASALVMNDVVYMGTFNNGMYAFRAQNGQILWHTGAHYTTQSTPVIANNVMYLSMTDGVYALNPMTGEVLWQDPVATDPSFLSFTKVMVSEGVVYVGITDNNGDSRLHAIDARYGTDFWQIEGITQIQPITVA